MRAECTKYAQFEKMVQKKFLAMHITNQNVRFNICTVGHLQNIYFT